MFSDDLWSIWSKEGNLDHMLDLLQHLHNQILIAYSNHHSYFHSPPRMMDVLLHSKLNRPLGMVGLELLKEMYAPLEDVY